MSAADARHWTDALVAMNACDEAVEWGKTQPDLATAWATCSRGDWMIWLLARTTVGGEIGSTERRRIVGVAAGCARLALPVFERRFPNGSRVRSLLDLLDRYAANDPAVTLDDIRTARRAAADAYAYAAAAADADAARRETRLASAGIARLWFPLAPVLA